MTEPDKRVGTPHKTLIEILLNPNVPKSEMEYAAAKEIEHLENRLLLLKAELDFVKEARAALQVTIKKIRALL